MNIFCSVCAQTIPHEEAIKGAKTHKENADGQLCRKIYRTWMNAQRKAARIKPEVQAMIRLIKSRKTSLEELRSVLPAVRRKQKASPELSQ